MTTKNRSENGSEEKSPAQSLVGDEGQDKEIQEAPDQLSMLRDRVAELEGQAADAADRHLRLAADFDNFRKRARQDQADNVRYSSSELVGKLLPVLDDLHRAIEHTPGGVDEGWRKGLELTVQKLVEVLESQGVTTIEAVGERFDPSRHEAIGTEESDEHPEDTVLTELRRGYQLHDRVLRPAMVRVARPVVVEDEQD